MKIIDNHVLSFSNGTRCYLINDNNYTYYSNGIAYYLLIKNVKIEGKNDNLKFMLDTVKCLIDMGYINQIIDLKYKDNKVFLSNNDIDYYICNGLYLNDKIQKYYYIELIYTIIKTCKINTAFCSFAVRVLPRNEDKKILDYISKINKEKFEKHLKKLYKNYDVVFKNIAGVNKYFSIYSSYTNVFYIDNFVILKKEVSKFLSDIGNYKNVKMKEMCSKVLTPYIKYMEKIGNIYED